MKIRAILRFRNEDLTRKRLIAGFKTQEELAVFLKINQTTVSEWETFKNYPKKRKLIEILEEALNCTIAEMFPPKFIKIIEEKTLTPLERVIDIRELPEYTRREYLLPNPEKAYEMKEQMELTKKCVKQSLALLTLREAKVLKLRFGLFEHKGYEHTLKETAEITRVSKERIRQIEQKALRKLAHPYRSKLLKEFI